LDTRGNDYTFYKPLSIPPLPPSPFGEGWGEVGARGLIINK